MALQAKLPHNFHAIVENADEKIDMSSMDKLNHQLCAGVPLKQNKQKFMLAQNGANSFEMFASDLSFSGGVWKWYKANNVQVAELVRGQDFEVTGKFDLKDLTPNTKYEVAFVIKMKDDAYGWEDPVTLKLQFPNGNTIENKEKLSEVPTKRWTDVSVGDFRTSTGMAGDMTISMYDFGKRWKQGLVIMEIAIRPSED